MHESSRVSNNREHSSGRSHGKSRRSSRSKMPFFYKRLVEVFFYEILISVIAVKIIDWKVIPETYTSCIRLIVVCLLVLLVPTWHSLADYLLGIRRIKTYFRVNGAVYCIMTAVVMLLANYNVEPVYTYLFFPYKLLFYAGFDKVFSAMVVSIINFVMVFLMPLIFSEHLKHQI